MVHYRGFVAKRLMPMGKHFYLDYGAGHEDPIVAEARSFPPVRTRFHFCPIVGRACGMSQKFGGLSTDAPVALSRHMRRLPAKLSPQRTTAITTRGISALSPSDLIISDCSFRSEFRPTTVLALSFAGLRHLLCHTGSKYSPGHEHVGAAYTPSFAHSAKSTGIRVRRATSVSPLVRSIP